MQDEVNEKVVALSIKTSKLTAEVLQKAMKAVLAKGKQQLSKAPHGKITMPLRYNKDKRKNPVFSRVSAFVVAYSIPFPTLIASEKSVE